MRRPRLTTRRLMMVVALVAVLMGSGVWLALRSQRFEVEASRHQDLWFVQAGDTTRPLSDRAWHHLEASHKYRRAARSPWLPVEPDPPEPPESEPFSKSE